MISFGGNFIVASTGILNLKCAKESSFIIFKYPLHKTEVRLPLALIRILIIKPGKLE